MWEVHPDGPQWSLRRTPFGRGVAALDWALKGGAGTFVFGFGFFGIDWLGKAAVGVDVPPTFWLTVLLFAMFGAFFGFLARMLRYQHWVIDREAKTLALSHRRAFADPQIEEVPFADLRRVVYRCHGLGRRSEIVAEFTDGSREALATSRLGKFAFDGVLVGLRRAFDETGVPVDVDGQE